jgi:hypothetical protein
MNILFKMGVLFFFENYINEWSEYTKYASTELKFSIYRSICCLFLFLYAILNILLESKIAFLNVLSYSSPGIIDLNLWFLSYVLVDIIFMIFYRIKRIDLWLHHIVFMIGVILYYKLFVVNLILLGESLSLFSAFDMFYIQNNMMYKSYLCKKIRKSVILYLRYPIWIYLSIFSIIQIFLLKTLFFAITGIIIIIGVMTLDFFWLRKCQKVINFYERH